MCHGRPADIYTVDELRVLLAEDSEISQIATGRLLRRHGIEVHIAGNGREAIERAAAMRYDAILMDCEMPEVDGFAAVQSIRSAGQGPNRGTLILAFTAYDTPDERARCVAAGMDGVIAKPLRMPDVQRVLDGRSAARDGSASRGGPATETEYELIDLGVAEDVLDDGGWEAGLIDSFLEQTESRLAHLRDAVERGDATSGAAIAHSLKGTCAVFGAARMARLAGLVDAEEGEQLLAQARAQLPALHELLPRTRDELERAAATAAAHDAS